MRPWSLHERFDERDITELITAYHNGATTATTASLTTTHSVSLSSVKRLLRTAGVRRAPSTRESKKATPTSAISTTTGRTRDSTNTHPATTPPP